MKRHGNLYDKICSKENLTLAYNKARKRKNWQRKVKKISSNLDYYIDKLHETLINGTYQTSEYKTKKIYEPKERIIYILPFYHDRIVHHAIMNVLEPIWDNIMQYHSYSCRKKKGMHRGSKKCMEYVRKYKYVLKGDVSKFYPSINHKILKIIILRKIKDTKLINLLFEIIDSIGGETNAPIGNFLSQWFGNLYLNEFDDFIKYDKRIKPYIRYCDDFVVFANDKIFLNNLANDIKTFVYDKLAMKLSKCNVFPVSKGVDFLGYRHFPDKILCRKRTVKSFKIKVKETMHLLTKGIITREQALSKIASVKGCLKHAQCHNLSETLDIDEIWKEVYYYEEVQ